MTHTRAVLGKIAGCMWVDASSIPLELTHFIKSSNVVNAESLVYKFFVRNIHHGTYSVFQERKEKIQEYYYKYKFKMT